MSDPILRTVVYILGAGFLGYLIYIIFDYIKSLRVAPREIWLLFTSQIFEVVAYTVMDMTLFLMLIHDVGMTEIQTGSYISIYGTGIIVITFLVGALVDAVGVRRILGIATVVAIISRFFLAATTNIYLLTILGFIPVAFAIAMLGPVIAVAIRRYTNEENAAMGFALFYTLLHIGGAMGGWAFDKIRAVLGEYGTWSAPVLGEISTYRTIMFMSFVLSVPAFLLVRMMRRGVELHNDNQIRIRTYEKSQATNFMKALNETTKKSLVDAFKIFKKVASQPEFWKFMLLLTIILGVKFVFFHFFYTFPQYGIRVLGKGAKVGALFATLHPILITVLMPMIASITKKVSPYIMLTVGTSISCASVFLVTIPEKLYEPFVNTAIGKLVWQDWLALDPTTATNVKGLYLAFTLFVIIFSIGESIWSPRLFQYSAQVAPKGQEGSYLALSTIPIFFARPLVGIFSGWLLTTYCPAGDTSQHQMVWVWIGATALITPLGMIFLRNFFVTETSAE